MAARWCFTLNNFTENNLAEIKSWTVKYICIGKEVGASGTPHLQGFVIFPKNYRLAGLKKLPGGATAHWEVTKGTALQASDYCKKEGDYVEEGECPKTAAVAGGEAQQERYKRAWDAAVVGDWSLIPEDIRIKHYKTLKDISKDHMVKPDDADGVTGVWFYGPLAAASRARLARTTLAHT